MKYIIFIFLTIFFTSCADKDAFEVFDLKNDQKIAFDNFERAKIQKDDKIYGIATAVYLNKIYNNLPNNKEYVYLVLFTKKKKYLKYFKIKINNNNNMYYELKNLPVDNKYSYLINFKNNWQNHYLLTFDKQETKIIPINIELNNEATATLNLKKGDI